ncbi:MAG TPA: hypothetical protein PKW61_05925, partial [Tenuifilaceae bacterium]|nr:hypothetical protein [Tenuifilaceae bacterium]
MDKLIVRELEYLTKKIENNQANLNDYQKYEEILLKGGLPKSIIENNLRKAGFNTWSEFVNA